jgi:hypothetical protein
MNEMDGKKKPLSNFFKLNALGKKRFSLGKKQNNNPNHVSLKEKGI